MHINHRRQPRRTHRTVNLNSFEISLAAERVRILEGSDYYRTNMGMLNGRMRSREITPEEANRIAPSIQMAALRQAGVSFRMSQALLRA